MNSTPATSTPARATPTASRTAVGIGSSELVLLRCPFCGAEPGFDIRAHAGKSYYAIGCKTPDCRGSSGNLGPDLEREVTRWNTRAPALQNASVSLEAGNET